MRLAYISDQAFYLWNNKWFTTASFPLDQLCDLFPFVSEWVIWGRLYKVNAPPLDLWEVTVPKAARVTFRGPWNMAKGMLGYLWRGVPYLRGAYKAIVSSDLVWVKLPFVASLALLAVGRSNRRVIFCHLVGDPEGVQAGFGLGVWLALTAYKRLLKGIIARCDLCVFVSEHLKRKYGHASVPTLVAHECRIAEEMFAPARDPSPHCPARILFVGRLSPEKGVSTLLIALTKLRGRIPLEAWIVGHGPQLGKLRAAAEQLGLGDGVKFLGRKRWGSELFSVMRQADVLVLPSRSEGLPLVLIEAMSQRLPVVATTVGGIPEIVQDRVSGLLVPPDSPDDLAMAIMEAIANQQLRETMIAHGLDVARRNTISEQTRKLVNAVEGVLVRLEQRDRSAARRVAP